MGRTRHRVVVVGAGYAGVLAANRVLSTLARGGVDGADAVELTVVNPRPDFVERIRLHELVAGSRDTASRPLDEVLHPAARVHVGTARRIDAVGRRLVGDGWELPYDTLVHAVGSLTATAVPGSAEYARPVGDPAGALRLRDELVGLGAGAPVAVVGGGLTGVETAAELAAARPDLRVLLLSDGVVTPGLSTRARDLVRAGLARLGVEVREGATVTAVAPGRLHLAGGGALDAACCVWAASMAAAPLAGASGLEVDHLGRLVVDETLRHRRFREIVGAGDAVAPPPHVAAHLRMACATAMPLGAHAASVVLAGVTGREEAVGPLSVGLAAQCLSLGRRDGVLQRVHRDDAPHRKAVGGRPAAVAKELICRYTVAMLRAERRRPGAYHVVAGPRPLVAPISGVM